MAVRPSCRRLAALPATLSTDKEGAGRRVRMTEMQLLERSDKSTFAPTLHPSGCGE